MKSIVIPKKYGTYADALVAIGMADLLTDIYYYNDVMKEPEIRDNQGAYEIYLPVELSNAEIEKWEPSPGYQYIKFKSTDLLAPLDSFNYEEQREIEKQYREFLKATDKKRAQRDAIRQEMSENGSDVRQPDLKLPLIKTFNSMRMGSNALNQMYGAILEADSDFRNVVASRLGILNSSDQINEKKFSDASSVLQLFNPTSGKGINRSKPDGAGLSSYPDKLTDWFHEWLKFRAFTKSMLTFNSGSDGKDTKVLVIAPVKIGPRTLERMQRELLEKRLYGSIILDIQAVLTLTELVVRHSEEVSGQGISMLQKTPKDIIGGLYQAYFKNLGTASAIMNISFLGLPEWFKINSREDGEAWIEIIVEHGRCIRSLDESHSDDVATLLCYRSFISTSDVNEALEFFARYATHYMQMKAQSKWAEPFTIMNLRRLFMEDTNIQEIIAVEGFQNISAAIRKSTVTQQMIKGMRGKADYEIRYGLAQEWKRKVHDKNEFVILLSDFVQSYNAENARKSEQGIVPRKNITDKDLNGVIELIEKAHSSKLVGMLLLAYGYAKASKDEDTNRD